MGHLSTRTTEQHYARVKQVAKTFEHLDEVPQEFMDSQMPRGFDSRRNAPSEVE